MRETKPNISTWVCLLSACPPPFVIGKFTVVRIYTSQRTGSKFTSLLKRNWFTFISCSLNSFLSHQPQITASSTVIRFCLCDVSFTTAGGSLFRILHLLLSPFTDLSCYRLISLKILFILYCVSNLNSNQPVCYASFLYFIPPAWSVLIYNLTFLLVIVSEVGTADTGYELWLEDFKLDSTKTKWAHHTVCLSPACFPH